MPVELADLKAILERYAAIKTQEKAIKAEINELGPVIKNALTALGNDKAEVAGVGTFTVAAKPVWKFSKAIEDFEEQVDNMKEVEKQNGTAEKEIRYDLIFKAAKTNDEETD